MLLAALFMAFVLCRPKLDGISVAGLWTRGVADLLTAIVTISGYPFQLRFTDLCERSANNLLSVSIFVATVVIDALTLGYLIRLKVEERRQREAAAKAALEAARAGGGPGTATQAVPESARPDGS